MSFANSSVPVIPLTRDGRWMLAEIAAKMLTEGGDVKALKKVHQNTLWLVIKHGQTNLPLHHNFNFVYVCYDKNEIANHHLPIKKVEFTRLSHYLSDDSNTSSPDEDMAALFKEYTRQEATVTNIERAFSVGALIISQSLKEISKRRCEEKKKAAKSVCTKGIGGKRQHRSTNITYRGSIGIVPDKEDVLRSDLCRNEGVKGGKCTKF